VQHGSRARVHRDGQRVGDGVIDGKVFALEHAVPTALSLFDFDEHRFDAVLAAFGGDHGQGELGADDGNVAPQLEQERNCPDVVFVGVVSTSASMSSSRSSIWRRSGRIRSTPGSSWVGNITPQSTISNRPRCSKTVMLRPISLMPPNAVTRNPPAVSGPGGLRSTSTSGPPFAYLSTEAARMSAASASICSGVAGICGSRGSRPRCPADAGPPWTSSRHRGGSSHCTTGQPTR